MGRSPTPHTHKQDDGGAYICIYPPQGALWFSYRVLSLSLRFQCKNYTHISKFVAFPLNVATRAASLSPYSLINFPCRRRNASFPSWCEAGTHPIYLADPISSVWTNAYPSIDSTAIVAHTISISSHTHTHTHISFAAPESNRRPLFSGGGEAPPTGERRGCSTPS